MLLKFLIFESILIFMLYLIINLYFFILLKKMSINFLYLYLAENLEKILYFSIYIFLSSLGITVSIPLIKGLLFIEVLYFALIIFASIILKFIKNHKLDFFINFVLIFTILYCIKVITIILILFKDVFIFFHFYKNVLIGILIFKICLYLIIFIKKK